MADNMNNDTGNTQQTPQEGQGTAAQGAEKLFTQEDVNRIVGERLSRVRMDAGDADSYRRERDETRKELEEYKLDAFLKEQGVPDHNKDYVLFKAGQMVGEGTDLRQAVGEFLKREPRWAGKGYRVSTCSEGNSSGSLNTGMGDPEIRKAMGLRG